MIKSMKSSFQRLKSIFFKIIDNSSFLKESTFFFLKSTKSLIQRLMSIFFKIIGQVFFFFNGTKVKIFIKLMKCLFQGLTQHFKIINKLYIFKNQCHFSTSLLFLGVMTYTTSDDRVVSQNKKGIQFNYKVMI